MKSSLVVGKVAGHFGVKGWLKVKSFTQPYKNIFTYKTWLIDGQSYSVAEFKMHGKQMIVRLEDMRLREQANVVLGKDICVSREQLPEIDEDDYYWCDLIGLQVIDQNEQTIGCVKDIFATGANDVLVVGGEKEVLIPYVPDRYIKKVNLQSGVMIVDWEEPE